MQDPKTLPKHLGRCISVDADGLLYDERLREFVRRMPGGPEDQEVFEAFAALRTTTHAIHVLMDRWTERHGLSDGRMRLLFMLRSRDMALGELAAALDVSPRNITGLVDALERDGLVVRVPDEQDRRGVYAHLTETGAERLRTVGAEMLTARRTLARTFTKQELAQLRHLCLRLLQNIGRLEEEKHERG